LVICWLTVAVLATVDADLRAVAALPGEPSIVAAAGVTRDDRPILTLENQSAFDPESRLRRAVIYAASGNERTAAAVIAMVRWMKTAAPARLRRDWVLSALPSADFDPEDKQSFDRWLRFQAADIAIEVVEGDGHPIGLGVDGVAPWVITAPAAPGALGSTLRRAARGQSPSHEMIESRVSRDPVTIARLLAERYPETPSISYIPAVAWTNTLRLSRASGDQALAEKVRRQTAPWTTDGQPLFGDRILLTAVAGTMVFAELGGDVRRLALEGARLAAARKPSGVAEYGQGWTDDMFMSSSILSRVGEYDAAAAILKDYAGRLQRADGLFIHATDGPFAWGRGNGFAALGLMEAITALPEAHPARGDLLAIFHRLMRGVLVHQSPDGMWRQVIDEPGAYREETVTAMLLTAMMRGVTRGWLDRSYAAPARRAWNALKAHIASDGTLIDVCTGTGAGPTKRYYLERAAITGADDRGGAMALLATMEMVDAEAKGR
jgi:rhamnogalacturonyl hydrolase YesR